jgi:hypothetical protein
MSANNNRRSKRSASSKAQQDIRSFFAVVGSKSGEKETDQNLHVDTSQNQAGVNVNPESEATNSGGNVEIDSDDEQSKVPTYVKKE